jgi:hypothetical protein
MNEMEKYLDAIAAAVETKDKSHRVAGWACNVRISAKYSKSNNASGEEFVVWMVCSNA